MYNNVFILIDSHIALFTVAPLLNNQKPATMLLPKINSSNNIRRLKIVRTCARLSTSAGKPLDAAYINAHDTIIHRPNKSKNDMI